MVAKKITVNGRVYALVPTQTPVVESPAPRFVCIEPGCYKEGHAFSETGAFGDATHKGHFTMDRNIGHARKAV